MDDFRIESLTERHYDAVAELFNASDEAWPGGLVHGNPLNRERIARRYADLEVVDVLVGMSGDRAVGILDIAPFHAERAAAYVNFLNVHPAWHGKGCGRRLLQRAVDVATAGGFERLDLYTWSGNMKAVPAYKKTGFFWYPGTSVYMQNFLPQILTAPPLASFFRANPWYGSFRRQIEVAEDLERRNGRRVYAYRFEGDAPLEVVVDVLSSRICSVRLGGDEWSLEAEGEELFVGYPKPVRCSGAGVSGPALSCKPGFSVAPAQPVERGHVGFLAQTSATAPRHREEERAEALDAEIATPGGPLRLGLGFLSRLPVEVVFLPSPGVMPPGGAGILAAAVCNRTGHEVAQATEVGVRGEPGARVECTLAPLERKVVDVPLSGGAGARVDARTRISGGPEYVEPVAFLSPGRLMPDAEAYEDRLFATDGRYLLEVEPNKGARMTLRGAGDAYAMAVQMYEEVGPPFRPGQMRARSYTARTDETPDGLRLTFEAESERPRLRVVRTVDLLKDGTIEIVRTVRNVSEEPASFQLMHTGWLTLSSRRVMPTPHGVADARPRADYPGWQDDLPVGPEVNPEGWTHTEGNGGSLGVAWPVRGVAELRTGLQSLPDIIWKLELAPGQEASVGPFVLIPGASSPDCARRAASRLNGPLPPARPLGAPVDVAVEPWPLLAAGRATIRARSLRETEVRGSVRWVARGAELVSLPLALKGFGQTASAEFDYSPSWHGAEPGTLAVATELEESRAPLTAASMAGAGQMSVREGSPWVVSNGVVEFRADPAYSAVLHSLRRLDNGREYLSSPYPGIAELAWFRPWRGGAELHAMPFDSYPGRLAEEAWTARELCGTLGGCEVAGVRLEATLSKSDKSLRGIVLTRDYLTARGSPVVVARTTVGGMGGALIELSDQIFTSFKSQASVAEFEDAGATVRALRHRATRWMAADGPLVIRDGDGPALVLDQHGGGMSRGYAMDLGVHGAHYEAYGAAFVAREPFTMSVAMVACRDAAEAARWSAVAGMAAAAPFKESSL